MRPLYRTVAFSRVPALDLASIDPASSSDTRALSVRSSSALPSLCFSRAVSGALWKRSALPVLVHWYRTQASEASRAAFDQLAHAMQRVCVRVSAADNNDDAHTRAHSEGRAGSRASDTRAASRLSLAPIPAPSNSLPGHTARSAAEASERDLTTPDAAVHGDQSASNTAYRRAYRAWGNIIGPAQSTRVPPELTSATVRNPITGSTPAYMRDMMRKTLMSTAQVSYRDMSGAATARSVPDAPPANPLNEEAIKRILSMFADLAKGKYQAPLRAWLARASVTTVHECEAALRPAWFGFKHLTVPPTSTASAFTPRPPTVSLRHSTSAASSARGGPVPHLKLGAATTGANANASAAESARGATARAAADASAAQSATTYRAVHGAPGSVPPTTRMPLPVRRDASGRPCVGVDAAPFAPQYAPDWLTTSYGAVNRGTMLGRRFANTVFEQRQVSASVGHHLVGDTTSASS